MYILSILNISRETLQFHAYRDHCSDKQNKHRIQYVQTKDRAIRRAMLEPIMLAIGQLVAFHEVSFQQLVSSENSKHQQYTNYGDARNY